MKILLSAYACEPNRGSEPGVGWNVAKKLAEFHQVWVFTSNTHRPEIETELKNKPVKNLRFIYFDPCGWVYDWSQEGKKSQLGVYFHYYLWQIWAYFVGRRLHQEVGFDVAHHVTYVKYSNPSFLSFLPVPFVWGPVGGAEQAPKPFLKEFTWRGQLYEFMRTTARLIGEADPFVHLTAQKSSIAIAATNDTALRLRRLKAQNLITLSESGLLKEEIEQLGALCPPDDDSFRFISMGRLLHWKGFELGLKAFAQAEITNAEYWIVGDGPEMEHLYTLASELGIAGQVKFFGRLPREEGLAKLGQCHVLVHPSLHDSGGWVCLEAMAAGRPVICLDLGGPGVQVTPDAGFKIQADTPRQTTSDLAEAMRYLATSPTERIKMGQAGRKLVMENFAWDRKIDSYINLYRSVLGKGDLP